MRNLDRWDTRPYLQRLGDAISQLANVALANGMPDESISGRAHRNITMRVVVKQRWKAVATVAEFLFWPLDKGNHCRLAYEQDLERSAARAAVVHKRASPSSVH